MKTIFSLLTLVIISTISYSQTISIAKANSNDPNNVCNLSEYNYTATLGGTLPSNYSVWWDPDNGEVLESSTTTAKIKWTSDSETDGSVGTIVAKIKNSSGTVVATSNTITVTIKSIKHLKPELSPNFAGQWNLSPCTSGSQIIDATELIVPGTGPSNPESVYIYEWIIPTGWTINGQTSNGTTGIPGGRWETIGYPANHTEGTIKVRGYHAVSGCSDGIQLSKWSDVINVKRMPTFGLTPNPNTTWLFCGDTNPITYTLTCTNMTLPCAAYFWQNSPNSTTSNTFTYTPNGTNNFTVVVRVVYGDSEQTKSKTIEYKVTNPNTSYNPYISGEVSICDNSTEYYEVENVPSDYYIDWDCTGSIQLKSAQGSNPAEFEKIGIGESTVEAKIITNCGNWPASGNIVKNVWAGLPANGLSGAYIVGPSCIEKGSTNNYFHGSPHPLIIDGADWYNWSVHPYDANIVIRDNHWNVSAMVDIGYNTVPGFYTLRIKAENDCGENPEMAVAFFEVPFTNCGSGGWFMSFSPNPTTGETTLSIKSENKEKTLDETAVWELEIYSPGQVLTQKATNLRGSSTTIQTAGWKDGIYTVRVKLSTKDKPNEILTGKLVVKR